MTIGFCFFVFAVLVLANGDADLCNCFHDHAYYGCTCVNTSHVFASSTYQSDCSTSTGEPIENLQLHNFTHYSSSNISDLINQALGASGTTRCRPRHLINFTLTRTGIAKLHAKSFVDVARTATEGLRWLNMSSNRKLAGYGEKAFLPIGANLTTLILANNPVRSLTKDVFTGLSSLEILDLSNNRIGYIEQGVFSSGCCVNIRELYLDSNILTVLDDNALVGLTKLERLDLRNNPLQQLSSGVFQPCVSMLMQLRMSHDDRVPFGGFSTIEPGLFLGLHRLTLLQLDELKITNLTKDSFLGLRNLKQLSMKGNRLFTLPSDVFTHLTSLERVDLSRNRLVCVASLPSSSSSSSSTLTSQTKEIDFLAGLNLKWIDLSWNRMTHLNRLTARSLGLFDIPQSDHGPRLVLNLTGNPWQHIDANTFCSAHAIRPTDLFLGPLGNVPTEVWRRSLGLWNARALWPKGPLSLVGESSFIHGLMLLPSVEDEETDSSDLEASLDSALPGSSSASDLCQQLTYKTSNETFELSSSIKQPSSVSIAYSLSTYCPRLSVRELEEWELDQLEVTPLIKRYNRVFGKYAIFEGTSRLYLLIIIGICLTFLLFALTAIICYRAWSRRSIQKPPVDGTLVLESPDQVEKQLLVEVHNTRMTMESAVDKDGQLPLVRQTQQNGANRVASGARTRARNRVTRPKSDPDASSIENANRLTALGVV